MKYIIIVLSTLILGMYGFVSAEVGNTKMNNKDHASNELSDD